MALKEGDLLPGQKISADHFICSTRGRLPNTYGKESQDQQYTGGAIFVDHASGFVVTAFQVHLNTHETLKSLKTLFDTYRDHGVVPQQFQSDNGTCFTSSEFQEHLKEFRQVSSFAGVGAHHHNGIAERSIRTIMTITRTCMLHAAVHWPEVTDAKLWPFAVNYAVSLFNHMPDPSTGLSPHDIFTRTRWPHAKFQDYHVWGCPTYVLEKALQDGKKLPRWKPRSNRHMFVGLSPHHASTVPLILNLDTGAVTPQFHIVYDDWFATVPSDPSSLPPFDSDEWQKLFGDSVYQYSFDDEETPSNEATPNPQTTTEANRHADISNAIDQRQPATPLPVPPPATTTMPPPDPVLQQRHDTTTVQAPLQREQAPPTPPAMKPSEPQPQVQAPPNYEPSLQREKAHSSPTPPSPMPPAQPPTPIPKPTPPPTKISTPIKPPAPPPIKTAASPKDPTPPRRSQRRRVAPQRYGYTNMPATGYQAFEELEELATNQHFANFANTYLPFAWAARVGSTKSTKDPDTLTFDEAMRSPDRDKWMEAARLEIEELIQQGTWVEVPLSDAKGKILPGTWTFRRKRTPDGEIKKYKGRWCLRGDLEEKQDVDNYAPVVAWSTVCMFLSLACVLEWKTVSLDFNNAFLHATLPEPIWAHLP